MKAIIYLIGTIVLIAGVLYGMDTAGVPQKWIMTAGLIIGGLGIMGAAKEHLASRKVTMNKITPLLTASLGLLLTPVLAEDTPKTVSPWDKDDGQWITIAGKITDAGVNAFTLDYGKGAITVEMDDYDKELEGFNLIAGDRVLVTGRVDADKDQKRSIEAASVYVKNVKKTFFASSDDDEEVLKKLRKTTAEGTSTVVTGKVIIIAHKFMTVDTGYQHIDVSTEALRENPFDKSGKFQIEQNDTVTVYGAVTDGFVNSSKLVASHIIER